jgi:hypothetical protein
VGAYGTRGQSAGVKDRGATRQGFGWRKSDTAHDAATWALDNLDGNCALLGLVAHREFGEDVGQRGRLEQSLDHASAGADQAADAIGEIVGQTL